MLLDSKWPGIIRKLLGAIFKLEQQFYEIISISQYQIFLSCFFFLDESSIIDGSFFKAKSEIFLLPAEED